MRRWRPCTGLQKLLPVCMSRLSRSVRAAVADAESPWSLGTRAQHLDEKARELKAEEGDDCTLILQLPNGDQHTHRFKLGTTVAYVKLQIEQLYCVPMVQQKLTCNGRALIDPLSLSDCSGITAAGSSLVVVEETGQ